MTSDADTDDGGESEGLGSELSSIFGPTPGENSLFSLASKYLPLAMLVSDLTSKHANTNAPTLPSWMRSSPSSPHAPSAPNDTSYYTYGAPPSAQNSSLAGLLTGASGAGGGPAPYAAGGYADDGELVHGDGSGRDDTINAKLSDGEYVMDAETVAMLGDGSVEEGARRLDQLRENIRKHKGAKLARGEFSPNAKNPEQYLGKGK